MALGKKSKRLTCRKKYKIAKLVRQHDRKMKKKAAVTPRKKSKKDPGIPNRFPFKEEILKEAEKRKQQKEEERQRQAEKRKKERQKVVAKKRNLESLAKDAKRRADDFDRRFGMIKEKAKEYGGGKAVENSLKAYYKEVKKVIEAADVVIEVLDARDPLGSRCPQVEEAVISHGPRKRLLLLLNKIDLVPKENVENWLKYLRNEFPTVPFKASTQCQSDRLGHSKVAVSLAGDNLRKSSSCLGVSALLTLLGNYCHSHDIKTSITIGIIGFPNTGKSSVINSLKRCKACNVGSTPGVTKTMQAVQLDKHIRLLDSPGVVVATNMVDTDAMVLRNCVRVECLEDPVGPVSAVVARCNKQQLMAHYCLPDFSDVADFLSLLAKRRGMLRKGGRPDANKAAKLVLQDWNIGRITYYTEPPETYTRSAHVSAEIVSEMSQAFDIDALLRDEETALQGLKSVKLTDIVLPSTGPTAGVIDDDVDVGDAATVGESNVSDDSDDEDMEVDVAKKQGSLTVQLEQSKKLKDPSDSTTTTTTTTLPALPPGNEQLNRQRKMDFKKVKKQRRRADVLAGELSSVLNTGLSGLGSAGDNYDFATDFL